MKENVDHIFKKVENFWKMLIIFFQVYWTFLVQYYQSEDSLTEEYHTNLKTSGEFYMEKDESIYNLSQAI